MKIKPISKKIKAANLIQKTKPTSRRVKCANLKMIKEILNDVTIVNNSTYANKGCPSKNTSRAN